MEYIKNNRCVSKLVVALLAGSATGAATAQDMETDSSRLSGSFGATVTSEYFFRGYLQEDNGFIAQPWFDLGISLYEPTSDDGVAISANVGIWNSFHSKHTGANGSGAEAWYEADLYGGLTFAWNAFEFGVGYTFYTYPSNSDFPTVQELGLTLGIDLPDEEWTGRLLGDLSFGVYFETDNSNVGDDEAAYFQFDFGPSFDVFDGGATLSFPVSLGLSLDDYYVGDDDETFGFLSVGAAIEVPLAWEGMGDVAFTAGVNALLLGETTETVNDDDDVAVYGYVGLSFSF